jgi:RinA family phage transcriptional activator
MKKRTIHQQNFRLIESELYYYKDTKKSLAEMEAAIIESSGHSDTGIRSGISNPTAQKAEKLLTSLEYIETKRRLEAIEYAVEVFSRCHEPAKLRLIEMKYFERKYTDEGIINEINIHRATFYKWKREFIELIANKLGFVI